MSLSKNNLSAKQFTPKNDFEYEIYVFRQNLLCVNSKRICTNIMGLLIKLFRNKLVLVLAKPLK